MTKQFILAAASALAATAVSASVPPAYGANLPPERHSGAITYITGGVGKNEAQAMKRAAHDYALELVFVQREGKKETYLADMPLRIVDAKGAVVFDGHTDGPYFLARLPGGRYTVSTHWESWSFTRPVTIGKDPQRVVFEWGSKAPRHAA